jgi:hypothetical protein
VFGLFDWTVFLASGCTCRTLTGIRRLTEDGTRTSDIVGDHVWRLAGDLNPQNLEDSAADSMVQYVPSQDEPFTLLKYRLPRYPVHSPCPSPRHPVRGREMARLTAQHSPIAKQHHPTWHARSSGPRLRTSCPELVVYGTWVSVCGTHVWLHQRG